ncbi:MAG: four helix bundle protein [Thermoflexales bacterium]|nr:four helix bundle protein [Thermoflexales bacterium]
MAKGDDIEERLIEFAVRVVKLCGNLPKTPAGTHVAGQLLRSGTAPAALYAEARGAESVKDFIHKLKICLKELNESRIWLIIVTRSELLPESRLQNLIQECEELGKIINASIKTARSGSSHAGNVPSRDTRPPPAH